jgi:hypothetical protein
MCICILYSLMKISSFLLISRFHASFSFFRIFSGSGDTACHTDVTTLFGVLKYILLIYGIN